jgi:elongation factor 1-beta
MSTKELNEKLASTPYVEGYAPTKADADLFKQLFGDNQATAQWAARMASYYQNEREMIAKTDKSS